MEGPERAVRPERAVGPEDKRLRTLDSAEEDDRGAAQLGATGYLAAVYRRPFDSRPGWARDDRGWEARPTVLEAAQRRLAFALSLAASRPAQRKPRATAPVEMLVADVVEMVGRGVVGLDYPASPPSVQALVAADLVLSVGYTSDGTSATLRNSAQRSREFCPQFRADL